MERGLSQCHLHRHHAGPSSASRRCHSHRRRQLPGSRKRTGSHGTPEKKMKHILTDSLTPYVGKVLSLYLELPETPLRTNLYDQKCAAELQFRSVPLDLIDAAVLLGSLRRLLRPPGALTLSPSRSMAYFQPVIDELLACPLSDNYVGYLRTKMKPLPERSLLTRRKKPQPVVFKKLRIQMIDNTCYMDENHGPRSFAERQGTDGVFRRDNYFRSFPVSGSKS